MSQFLRNAIGFGLAGATAYLTADALNESLMYFRAKQLVAQRVQAGQQKLEQELGANLELGPWYNSSVRITHSGHLAAVTMPLRGESRASDVRVRLVRKGGLRWTLLYNIFAPEWEVMVMDALIGSEGGLPVAVSMMPPPGEAQAAAADCAACGTGSSNSASAANAAAGSGTVAKK